MAPLDDITNLNTLVLPQTEQGGVSRSPLKQVQPRQQEPIRQQQLAVEPRLAQRQPVQLREVQWVQVPVKPASVEKLVQVQVQEHEQGQVRLQLLVPS